MAYVTEYDLYTGNKDELGAGTDAFDAAFEIAFALNPDGTIDDVDICRKTIQTFGLMYVAGKFDKALVVESLTEDTDNLDALLDSEEFKKPISDKEIETIYTIGMKIGIKQEKINDFCDRYWNLLHGWKRFNYNNTENYD